MLLYKQRNKKIGIFGLGITGVSVFESVLPISQNILCYSDDKNLRKKFSNHIIQDYIVPIDDSKWTNLDFIVVSPAIPYTHKIFELAANNNIKILSDIELFYEEVYDQDSTIVTVTGTNGKSTICKFIAHILQCNNISCALGGNIGVPALSLPANKKYYVLELSSFQLSLINNNYAIKNKIGILLNIAPDHLDFHQNFSEYYNIKKRIFHHTCMQIICANDSYTSEILNELLKQDNHKVISCIHKQNLQNVDINLYDVIYDNNYVTCNDSNIYIKNILKNVHPQNIAIMFALNQYLQLPIENIISAIEKFKPLEHRIEFVNEFYNINNYKIQCYNDSKATNIHAGVFSMHHFKDIILLVGGILKEENITLPDSILANIKHVYCFGKSKDQFLSFFTDNNIPSTKCNDMNEIFKYIYHQIDYYKSDTTILLAPCCASYDQFQNFEERGNIFKLLCNELKNNYEHNQKANETF